MAIEQENTLAAIQIAIQMEIDGKEFYLKADEESSNEPGKKLLKSLAAAEDEHLQKFVEIYDTIRSEKDWPIIIPQFGLSKELKTIFAEATEELGTNVGVYATELGAIEKAMEMENKTYDFYKSREQKINYDVERDFYQSIAAEEREHYLVLLDYYEYLKDPAGYFISKERSSLDGG